MTSRRGRRPRDIVHTRAPCGHVNRQPITSLLPATGNSSPSGVGVPVNISAWWMPLLLAHSPFLSGSFTLVQGVGGQFWLCKLHPCSLVRCNTKFVTMHTLLCWSKRLRISQIFVCTVTDDAWWNFRVWKSHKLMRRLNQSFNQLRQKAAQCFYRISKLTCTIDILTALWVFKSFFKLLVYRHCIVPYLVVVALYLAPLCYGWGAP